MSVMCAVFPTETSGKSKKKVHRLRTGCWTCRRRGYKCDEGKPSCFNCSKMKIECEGYGIRLKWPGEKERTKSMDDPFQKPQSLSPPPNPFLLSVPDMLSDYSNTPQIQMELLPDDEAAAELVPGISSSYQHVLKLEASPRISVSGGPLSDASITSMKLESPPTISPSPFLSQNQYSSNPYEEVQQQPTQYSSDYSDDLNAIPIKQEEHFEQFPMSITEDTTILENRLLTHFSTTLSEQLSPLETSTLNVYRDVMIPFSNDSVKYAICALSACNLASLSIAEREYYNQVSVQYKVAAIKELREKLTTGNGSFDQDDLSTSLLLATLESLDGNYNCWVNHIAGATRGLSSLNTSDPEIHALINLMEYHDTTSSILSQNGPLLPQTGDDQYSNSNILLKGIDNTSFSTIAASLYRIVSTVSSLSSNITNSVGSPYHRQGPFCIPDDSLWTEDMLASRMDIFLFLDLWNISPLNLTPDAYNATMVLKNCLALYSWTRLDGRQLGSDLSPEVYTALSQALYHLQQIPASSGVNSMLVWPLWQLGILCDNTSDQLEILDRLEQIRTNFKKPNVETVSMFLTKFWTLRRDSSFTNTTRRSELNVTYQSVDPVIFF